jgi:hypothetical protein
MSDDLETELNKIICTQIGVFPFIVFGFVFMSELRVCVCVMAVIVTSSM